MMIEPTHILEPHEPNRPMMECGCRATGRDRKTQAPVCVIHIGLVPGASIVASNQPDLSDRFARCAYSARHFKEGAEPNSSCSRSICTCQKSSTGPLAFFKYRPEQEFDEFYCGCWGWN
jgi:hypothetical protein